MLHSKEFIRLANIIQVISRGHLSQEGYNGTELRK
jgi:hypothetical protein